MAKAYLDKLNELIEELDLEYEVVLGWEVRHFFSGAALYVNGTICASWSPVGLAFKLPGQEVESLISRGLAKPLKYFPGGHIKKEYALFENPAENKAGQWKKYFMKAARLA
ncbi:hypothetical protein D1BOALGB6SA_3713 [Olavius sp. associated proteobacterium Delta 1]|nr:hypothetical protein D1BOALGB6SA_3713 [Olavius sp. associated proteobacterium Delta 1]